MSAVGFEMCRALAFDARHILVVILETFLPGV
jgi:hypothetical protein